MVLLLIGIVVSPSKQIFKSNPEKSTFKPIFATKLTLSSQKISYTAPWFFHWWLFAAALYYFIGAQELIDNPWNFHIFNPAVAALAGHGMLTIGGLLASVFSPLLQPSSSQESARKIVLITTTVAVLLVISSVSHVRLKGMYSRVYGEESYELGQLLRQVSEPEDLVVSISSDLGDPNVIYYSQRRGWTFPPADNDIDWRVFPENESDSIKMFENLRMGGGRLAGNYPNSSTRASERASHPSKTY